MTDDGAREIAALCGPLDVGVDGIERLTNNTAELKAVIEALRFARNDPAAKGRPVLLRYDSAYAALISCGVWKAKANKALAKVAQDEWALTRRKTGGRLWLSHVKGHSGHRWNHRADRLADAGRHGETQPPGLAPGIVVD